MKKTVTGSCPESHGQVTISVTFERIELGGGLPSDYKLLGYSCPFAQENGCTHNGPDGRSCPLLHQSGF